MLVYFLLGSQTRYQPDWHQVALNKNKAHVWENEQFVQPSESELSVIDDATLRKHLKSLSADEFEGRGVGTNGELKAVKYLMDEMKSINPSIGITQQYVPLVGMTLDGEPLLEFFTSDSKLTVDREDFVVSTDMPRDTVQLGQWGEDFLFIGYGIESKQYHWDDYKNVDVSGKILLSLVNEPMDAEDPQLFKGIELTYYGRWMYKLEEARRRKAKGLIFIHTEETAGYPFKVLQLNEAVAFREEHGLSAHGWISEAVARRLAHMCGTTLNEWMSMATKRSFQPQKLDIGMRMLVNFKMRMFEGINLLAFIRGSTNPEEYILFSAHHDHLGMSTTEKQDNIFNGAIDNASGLAMLLASLKFFSNMPTPERSLAFVSFTAEETGLHGSLYYTQHPVVPLEKTVANINFDVGNVFGETLDIVGLGADKSTLGSLFEHAAWLEGLEVAEDPQPDKGSFYRADSFAFTRANVPSLYLWNGHKFVNQDKDYYTRVRNGYVSNRYHRPSDEYNASWSMRGLVQQTRVAVRVAQALAHTSKRPHYFSSEIEAFKS